MSEMKHAIKIEQLKNEKSKMVDPLQLRLVRDVAPRIRTIDVQLCVLEKERRDLINEATELRNRINSTIEHFDLMIKAYSEIRT
jgi:wobble nucleotide-excising tRNase